MICLKSVANYRESIAMIEQGKPQSERLQLLNKLAIRQLKAIQEIDMNTIKRIEGK